MKATERAESFVRRADAALAEPETAADSWAQSIRSNTDERLVFSFPSSIDRAIRRISTPYAHWDSFEPSGVSQIVDGEALQLLAVLSGHPSGWVRQEVVRAMAELEFTRFAPHIANRTLDVVPSIRELAQPILASSLDALYAERRRTDSDEQLPSATNMAIARLLRPRAATLCPELVHLCIALADTSPGNKPGRLRSNESPAVVLAPFYRAAEDAPDGPTKAALEAMIEYMQPAPSGHNTLVS